MTTVALYPAWKQAVADLLALGLEDGKIIPDEWFNRAFGIEPANTIAQHERNRMLFNSQAGDLRRSLLENHRIDLRRVDGVGYVVVPAEEQTRLALQDRGREVSAALAALKRQVSFVRVEKLTDAQRKENTDALARIGNLQSLAQRRLSTS